MNRLVGPTSRGNVIWGTCVALEKRICGSTILLVFDRFLNLSAQFSQF